MKMKNNTMIIALLFAVGLSPLSADPNQSKNKKTAKKAKVAKHLKARHVRVQVEYIDMPLLTMSELLDDDKATETDSILRARVTELIKAGKAKIMESQMLVVRDGEKSTVESVNEFIYPTEYEPPEIPFSVQTSSDGVKTKEYAKDLAVGPTPTAFETRNLGSTFEVQPTIGKNSKYIDLRLAPEIVAHSKNITYGTWKDKRGNSDIVMPQIYVMRINSAITVINGKPALLGVLSPKNAEGHVDYTRKVMVFVKANIINLK